MNTSAPEFLVTEERVLAGVSQLTAPTKMKSPATAKAGIVTEETAQDATLFELSKAIAIGQDTSVVTSEIRVPPVTVTFNLILRLRAEGT